ncbi:MAG: FtsK/SpoIIIE domain-containing protein, partial [Chloroflexota bacterium]
MAEPKYIDRPPRIQPELPKHEFEIPPPPNKEEGGNQLLIQVALPLLTIIGYVFVAAAGGRSALLLIPMGIAVVGSSALAFYTARRNKQLRAEKEAAYHERLLELRSEMDRYHDAQRRFYNYNYPDPATVLALAATAASQATTTPSPNGQPPQARLWERRTSDGDFGRLRLGIGTLPSTVTYEISQADNFDDPQMRDALRLDNDSRYVSDVPITIPLRQPAGDKVAQDAPPVRHALGIAGNKEAGVYACARAILTHYAAFHAPTDARLYVLGQNKTPWQWATPLPHCQEAKGQTLCFEDDQDREAGKEKSNVYQFLKILRRTLDERKLRLEDQNNRADVTLPFLLIVVDLLRPLPDNSRLKDLESDPAFSLLFEEGVRLGAAVIFLVPTRAQIPGGCNAVVEVTVLEPNADPDPSHRHEVSFIYAEVGVNTPRYVGRADFLPRVEAVTEFARQLSPLTIRKSYGADLPLSVPLLDMLNVSSIEELRQQTLENWERSQKTAEWLKAPIGRLSGGDVRALTLSADADGVHGLVAGSTGSGKSELLMTLILALALHYDPSIINFVLVDFKGGTAFDPFKTLPHCVDIVTNLSTSAVERMFAAIKAELNRRQALNVATESKHIVHYRERGLHAPPYGQSKSIKDKTYSTAPYPHLFIIIDEFAEMIAEKPEFKAELNSITRLGRALGVTLILAAQRPSGVTDQMRANIKFRICLRVETREESSEVLRRPDAAYLPNGVPGRGYLQVGNESIEVVQVAYSGGEYTGAQQSRPKVIWKNRPKAADSSPAEEEAPKLYKVLVDMVKETAQTHSLR